jgi:dienelactone hydrolase
VEHEVVTHPDAPHSFFDHKHAEFTEASADAWRRALSFLGQHA